MSTPTQPAPTAPVFEGDIPDSLLTAFWAYEDALRRDDVEALSTFFGADETAVRADGEGILRGSERIDRFRASRGGAAPRRITRLVAQSSWPETHLLIAESRTPRGGLGVHTQLWARGAEGRWVIRAAHVSSPAPAVDPAIWREVGTPLVAPSGTGPLDGLGVAVKDLFALEGRPIGGGVPAYLAEADPEPCHAAAVTPLLAGGAEIVGIARTDQFAYSIAGRNPHYGTPRNGAVRDGLPGGSSSGPASAVATGQADVGLATDTAGSVRVPASYQGLWGLRTTHGAVSVEGLLALAPDFDTVGWLTRDLTTLEAVARQCLPTQSAPGAEDPALTAVLSPELLAMADPEVREGFTSQLTSLRSSGALTTVREIEIPDPADLLETFRVVQSAQAWRVRGDWVRAHPGAVLGDEADRFEQASRITAEEDSAARAHLRELRERLDDLLGEDTLLLPTAPSAAPDGTAGPEAVQRVRVATLSMTCLASMLGRPAVSAPVLTTAQGPVGLCLVGRRHEDLRLLAQARALESEA